MLNFIRCNLNYPTNASGQKDKVRVGLRFKISGQGKVEQVEVIKSANPTCDAEAVRVLKLMPSWIPGTQNSQPTGVFYTIPISFETPAYMNDTVYEKSDIAPEFPGGNAELFAFLAKNIGTNDIPMEMCYAGPIGGTVICRFIVEKNGTLSHLEVLKSLDHEFDAIALNAIAQMPQWKPASLHGKPVRAYYTLPVRIRFE